MIKFIKSSQGFGLIGILIVIAVIALASGGGLYWKETQKQKAILQAGNELERRADEVKKQIEAKQNDISKELGENSKLQSSIDTSTWKTYHNEKYGIEFKYPDGWKIFSQTVNYLGISNRELTQATLQKHDIYINIAVDNNASKSGDLTTWANFNVHVSEFAGYDIQVIDEQKIMLAGKPAIRIIYDSRAPNTDETDRVNLSFVIANGKGYMIGFGPSNSELRPIFDTILSTFKFIK